MTAHEFHGNTILSLPRSLEERGESNIEAAMTGILMGNVPFSPWLGHPLASYRDFVLHRCQHRTEAWVFIRQELGRLVELHHLGQENRRMTEKRLLSSNTFEGTVGHWITSQQDWKLKAGLGQKRHQRWHANSRQVDKKCPCTSELNLFIEHYNQSHTFLTCLWIKRPIRGV